MSINVGWNNLFSMGFRCVCSARVLITIELGVILEFKIIFFYLQFGKSEYLFSGNSEINGAVRLCLSQAQSVLNWHVYIELRFLQDIWGHLVLPPLCHMCPSDHVHSMCRMCAFSTSLCSPLTSHPGSLPSLLFRSESMHSLLAATWPRCGMQIPRHR